MIDVDQVYRRHVESLSEAEQLRLIGRIVDGITQQHSGMPQRSIMELRGRGADVWRDVDAETYVDELRREWDERQ